jgi:hypothetical protein
VVQSIEAHDFVGIRGKGKQLETLPQRSDDHDCR